jgi:hypothetical protein
MKAHELLDSPEKWGQYTAARDSKGQPVHPRKPEACSWCLIGALHKCYPDLGIIAMSDKIHEHLRTKHDHHNGIPDWNDTDDRTYEEVVTLLKELDI